MKRVLTSLLFLALGFTGCINDAESLSPANNAAHGSARMRIPIFPSATGAPKSSIVDTTRYPAPTTYSAFEVTISGPGMAPMTHSYSAGYSGQVVEITDIPSGPSRTFTGLIIERGSVTHKGSSTVDVTGGQVTPVTLVLRNVSSGAADICIVVEDWVNSNSCATVDTLPPIPGNFTGFWQFQVEPTRQPVDPRLDTTINVMPVYSLSGNLQLTTSGDQVKGNLNVTAQKEYEISGYSYKGGSTLTFTRYEYSPGPTPLYCIYDTLDSTCVPPQPPRTAVEVLYVRVDSPLFDYFGNALGFKGWIIDSIQGVNQIPVTGTPTSIVHPILIHPVDFVDTLTPVVYDTNYTIENQSHTASGSAK